MQLEVVFGAPLNEPLIHAAVKLHGQRATRNLGDKDSWCVSGAGRKLWKQKGTGRARIASLRSPLWKGGGNVRPTTP